MRTLTSTFAVLFAAALAAGCEAAVEEDTSLFVVGPDGGAVQEDAPPPPQGCIITESYSASGTSVTGSWTISPAPGVSGSPVTVTASASVTPNTPSEPTNETLTNTIDSVTVSALGYQWGLPSADAIIPYDPNYLPTVSESDIVTLAEPPPMDEATDEALYGYLAHCLGPAEGETAAPDEGAMFATPPTCEGFKTRYDNAVSQLEQHRARGRGWGGAAVASLAVEVLPIGRIARLGKWGVRAVRAGAAAVGIGSGAMALQEYDTAEAAAGGANGQCQGWKDCCNNSPGAPACNGNQPNPPCREDWTGAP